MSERVIQARVRGRRRDERREKAMEIAMEVWENLEVSLLDQLKIEAQVLVPVLEALRAELGKERADQLVTTAVRDWRREAILRAGQLAPGSSKERWERFIASNQQKVGTDIDMDVLKAEPDALDVDVTGCRFADLFGALGEPELGAALACECDDHVADLIGSEIEYRRTQTIMKGASCCDFRYRMRFEDDISGGDG